MLDAAQGLTAALSAQRHGVSMNSVNTSLKHAKHALGARSIAHAVALCLAYNEFDTDDITGN